MNLPYIIEELVKAQEFNDSSAFADCFTEQARVFDESKIYSGKEQIKSWMERTSKEYNMVMSPIGYYGDKDAGTFKTKVSGSFPGSPIVFNYHVEFDGGLIHSLKISD